MKVKATYTPAEVAKMMGRPKSTVYRWVESGELITVQIGKQRLVPLAALRTMGLVWQSILMANKLAELALKVTASSGNIPVPG